MQNSSKIRPNLFGEVMESGAAADTVLKFEKQLSAVFTRSTIFFWRTQWGNGTPILHCVYKNLQWHAKGMVEAPGKSRSISLGSFFWYTAWNTGQPGLTKLSNKNFSDDDLKEFESLNSARKNSSLKGREHE